MKQVIFIGGTAFSGSTMLDMILSNDPRGLSLGEINALFRPYRKHHFEEIEKTKKDKIWESIIKSGEDNLYKNIFNTFPDIDFLVDSSKDPLWIAKQINILKKTKIDVKNILIYKTPIEIANSFHKRKLYAKWERSWINYYRLYFSLINNFIIISYKDLVNNKETLEGVCEYLGIPYFNSKIDFWNKEQFTFFGNNRTRFHTSNLVFTGDEKVKPNQHNYRKIYYEKVSNKVVILNVEDRIQQNPLISLIFSILKENTILSETSKLPLSLKFNYYQILLRKLKNTANNVLAIFKYNL